MRNRNTKAGRIGVICALIACILFAAFREPARSASETGVRVKGTYALVETVDDLSRSFREAVEQCLMIVGGGSPDKAIRGFLDKDVEIVLSERDLTDEEKAEAKSKGIRPLSRNVAWDATGVIVHPQNPIRDLTLQQLARIFTGEYTSWKEVGGPDWPIKVMLISPEYSTHFFFRTKYMGNRPYVADAVIRRNWGRIISRVSATRESIALCTANKALAAAAMVKIIALRTSESQPPVVLSRGTIADGSYPIRQPLFFIWDASAGPCTIQFIDFCFKRGVELR
jgi:phosphate transport system substrate-binding protein